MIGYREIIAVAVFMTVAVIIIIWLIVKKAREKKIEEIKDRRLRGEDVEKEKDSIVRRNWFKNENIKYFFPVITQILVYTAILVSFSILLPDLWKKYWGRQEFFWISLLCLITIVILGKPGGFWRKWMPIALFGLILFLYVKGEWPKPEKDDNDSGIVAKTDVRQDSNTLNIVAPVGKWSEVIKAKNRYNWRWYQDDTNYKNVCSLIKVRINGNETVEEYYLPDGTRTGSCFSTTAYFVEFQSKEAWPVDMVVKFVK